MGEGGGFGWGGMAGWGEKAYNCNWTTIKFFFKFKKTLWPCIVYQLENRSHRRSQLYGVHLAHTRPTVNPNSPSGNNPSGYLVKTQIPRPLPTPVQLQPPADGPEALFPVRVTDNSRCGGTFGNCGLSPSVPGNCPGQGADPTGRTQRAWQDGVEQNVLSLSAGTRGVCWSPEGSGEESQTDPGPGRHTELLIWAFPWILM